MLSLKRLKLELRPETINSIADDLADLALSIYGAGFFASVVPVACGHSRRTNCLSACLSVSVADRIGAVVVRAFEDRFVEGVSHPKEFARLPPLVVAAEPTGPVLIVDDVATSGFHMHEAVTALRQRGIAATGLVWASGTKQG